MLCWGATIYIFQTSSAHNWKFLSNKFVSVQPVIQRHVNDNKVQATHTFKERYIQITADVVNSFDLFSVPIVTREHTISVGKYTLFMSF